MNNKEELIYNGYELLGKYDEELFSYFKLSAINNVPGVSYYFVNQQGILVGDEKFISKKDIGLAVNLQGRIASKQKGMFRRTSNKTVKNKRK